jgi:hypothetical protein
MLRIISFLALAFMAFLYAVGFIYDSGYLLEFGYDSIQLPASPQEYLVFGSVFVLTGVVKQFTVFFYGLGVIASGYKPIERILINSKLSRYIDIQSLPYIMTAAMLPMLILMVGTILSSGQADAKQIKRTTGNQELTFTHNKDQYTCSGSIIRNRNNMLLFYDQNSKQTILTPYSNVMKNVTNFL